MLNCHTRTRLWKSCIRKFSHLDALGLSTDQFRMYAWTAVVRGAVIRGLEGSVVMSRRSRMHYGTSYATIFDDAKHPLKDRYWSPLWERWMVSDRMQWHIAKVTRPHHLCQGSLSMLTHYRGPKSSKRSPYLSITLATSGQANLLSSKTIYSPARKKMPPMRTLNS
jgi:hypothetical protein